MGKRAHVLGLMLLALGLGPGCQSQEPEAPPAAPPSSPAPLAESTPAPDTHASPPTPTPIEPSEALPVPPMEPPSCPAWKAQVTSASDTDFPWGIASGAVRHDRAVVWGRTHSPARVRARYVSAPECHTHLTDWVETWPDANVVHLPLNQLTAGTEYHYALEREGGAGWSAPGRLVTPPRDEVPVTLAFSADVHEWNVYHVGLPVFSERLREVDALISLGDWPYAGERDDPISVRFFRRRHLKLRTHASIRSLLRATAVLPVWDDHEVRNNWDATTSRTAVRNAVQVWHEMWPVEPARPGEMYRRVSWGPGVELFLLDTRSHRSANKAAASPDKTMLGPEQRTWLLEGLAASRATFKIVATSVPLEYSNTGRDAWRGFVHERETIFQSIAEAQVTGVVFITADQHWMAAHHLPNGLKSFQAGPMAAYIRKPSRISLPDVVATVPARNLGLLRYQPGDPPTLEVSFIDAEGKTRYTEVLTPGQGQLEVRSPHPLLRWTLGGAHSAAGVGSATLRLPLGDYTLTFAPLVPGVATPAPVSGRLTPSQPLVLGHEGGESQAIFHEPFDSPTLDKVWKTIEPEGMEGACAVWLPSMRAVAELGRCADRKAKRNGRKGTLLIATHAPSREHGVFATRILAGRGIATGIVYSFQEEHTFYRLTLERDRRSLSLERIVAGRVEAILGSRRLDLPLTWLHIAVERRGSTHRVSLNGAVVLEVEEEGGGLGPGTVGLYSYGMADVRFDDVMVVE